MLAFKHLFIVLAAPVYYWTAGVGLSSFRKPSPYLSSYVVLLGILAYGFVGELSLIIGINYYYLSAGMTCLVLTVAFIRRDTFAALLPEFGYFLFYYLIAVLAATAVLFPIPGHWSGDWFENYRLGRAVEDGILAPDLVARTPVFGASSLPVGLFTDGLCALQITAALTSAAAAMAIRGILQMLNKNKMAVEWSVLLLCLSGMYLQHSAFPWAKMLAAGCIFAAVGEIIGNPTAQRAARNSSLWLGTAIAVHQAAILFVPAVWCINFLWVEKAQATWWLKRAALFGIAVVLIALPYEIWTTLTFGLQEKLHRNPAVYFRVADIGYVEATAGILINSFVPDPRPFISLWANPDWGYPAGQIATRLFFTLHYYTTSVAGTLFLAILPFLFFSNLRLVIVRAFRAPTRPQIMIIWAVVAAICGNAMLAAYSSPVGTLQAGLTPLGLAAVAGASIVVLRDPKVRLKAIVAVLLLQTLPWFVLEIGLLLGAQNSALRAKLLQWEPDFQLAAEHFGQTLASRILPFQVLLAAIALVIWIGLKKHSIGREEFI